MFSNVVVYVKHKSTNSITKEIADEEMIIKIYVRPETEAEYPDGMIGLQDYLRENSEDEVNKLDSEIGFLAIVYFTINEEGKAEDIEVSESSAYKEIDDVLRNVILNMPQWKAATDLNGNNVKQKFEFVFGFGNEEGGGC
jgi:hypothetical protein